MTSFQAENNGSEELSQVTCSAQKTTLSAVWKKTATTGGDIEITIDHCQGHNLYIAELIEAYLAIHTVKKLIDRVAQN